MGMDKRFEEKYITSSNDYWWFRSRRQLLDILFQKYNCRGFILEGGCGSGENFNVLEKYGRVIGIDISERLVKYGRNQGKNIIVGDVTKLPFSDETFSVVVLFDVIEHVDDNMALREAARVLKPGGKIIVSVPAFRWLWSYHDVVNGHRKRYSLEELRALLEQYFNVLFISYWNFTLFLPSAILKKMFNSRDNLMNLPRHLNSLLTYLSSIDNFLIQANVRLPVGTSVVAVGEKR